MRLLSMIKVSIIVPVYNVENYLEKCLSSLTGQTLHDIEIIVVNDGSTDHSADIIKRFAAKDNRIMYLTKSNGGLSDARNYGIPYAQGKYLGFIDSDDYVEPDMFEKLYHAAEKDQSDFVECNLFHDFENAMDTEYGKEIYNPKEMLMMGRSVVWNKIYRREWLLSTNVQFLKGLIFEDVAFYAMILPYVKKVSYIQEPLIHYVQRENSLNKSCSVKTLQILDILENIKNYYIEHGFYREYYEALEFLSARIILCSSFRRMLGIANKEERQMALNESWKYLTRTYPNWRKNAYLKKQHNRNAVFMKLMTPMTYQLSQKILYRLYNRDGL